MSTRSTRSTTVSAWVGCTVAAGLALAAVAAPDRAAAQAPAAASAAPPGAAAVDAPQPGWQVLHCGVARGVLWMTYAVDGRAAITPAFDTPAVRAACARAGHALAASAPGRSPPAPAAAAGATAGQGSAPVGQTPSASAPPPVVSALALGPTLTLEARNDSAVGWRCTVHFEWRYDDDALGLPQVGSAQMLLPPRQQQRVTALSGGARNLRLVGSPRSSCTPAN